MLRYRVITGRMKPSADGSPMFILGSAGAKTSDLETAINEAVQQGWEVVQLTIPSEYVVTNGQPQASPVTLIFRRNE